MGTSCSLRTTCSWNCAGGSPAKELPRMRVASKQKMGRASGTAAAKAASSSSLRGSLLIGQRLLTQTGEEAREAVEQERVVKLLRGNGFSQAVLLTRTEVCEHSVTRGKSCLPVCRLKIAAAAR